MVVPLVIFLHGADAIGRDNEAQLAMHDIGTMFADAGGEAKAAMHHIEDIALTMMKEAATARQEQEEGEP